MATSALTSKPQTRFLDHCFNGIPLISRVSTSRSLSYAHSPRLSISASASSSSDLNSYRFEPIKESIVAREMTRRYMTDMISYADTDVVVVGAGSARLSLRLRAQQGPLRQRRHRRAVRLPRRRRLARWPALLRHARPQARPPLPRRAPNPLRRAGDLRRHQARRALNLHDPPVGSSPVPMSSSSIPSRRRI
ncbi:hypothetical protein J5N97_011573 [Dioscorea zingiberensis]|uniref:Uncharacterized protein n=1 Tax=Dioscorea zingiberensis TaxID=325984 RepID=A0A9D5D3B7_9LILI|nr:hypothetical protein J5N97_011573 [Dioscorea zingiberensis]